MRNNKNLQGLKLKLIAAIDLVIEEAAKNPRFRKKLVSSIGENNQIAAKVSKNIKAIKATRKKEGAASYSEARPTIAIYKDLGEDEFTKYALNLEKEALLLICTQELDFKMSLAKKMTKEEICAAITKAMKTRLDKGRHFLSIEE